MIKTLKKTKILCTIGPKNASIDILRKMYNVGMNGVRINTAFGDKDQHEEIIANVREIGEIPILLDLKGPEIRIKLAKNIELEKGDFVQIGAGDPLEFNHAIYDQLNVYDKVLIDNGKIVMRIVEKNKGHLKLIVDIGGKVENGKGVNIPGKILDISAVSDRDMEALDLARQHRVEFIALSFVRAKRDILSLKEFMRGLQAEIIAKIENHQGVENFEEILREADGVMVARGDLGIEMDLERVPLFQKHIIERCNQEGKLVITATEMLESMINKPTPTRAEVSDVANAILDGTDVLMLSEESAIGRYPVEAVTMMAKISEQIESSTLSKVKEAKFQNISSTISRSIWRISEEMPLDVIITMTRTGYTAKMITRFKLQQPIIAITATKTVKNQLELYYGVKSIQLNYETFKDRVLSVAQILYSEGALKAGDNVLFTAGIRTSRPHASNLIEIHSVGELLEFGKSQ